tara:strand:+ start:204 stop:470 length:267 start_codon:yes stop_codon:yes gene_type:complete
VAKEIRPEDHWIDSIEESIIRKEGILSLIESLTEDFVYLEDCKNAGSPFQDWMVEALDNEDVGNLLELTQTIRSIVSELQRKEPRYLN